MEPRLLLLDTAHRSGWLALAAGERLLAQRPLAEARRHARDLVPLLGELLNEQGWRPRDLAGIMVSRGPGSYTGLRVGLMSAKTLAWATGCRLLGLDTFAAMARQAPPAALRLDVLADAQQDKIYVQGFQRASGQQAWQDREPLRIVPLPSWRAAVEPGTWVTGPALEIHEPTIRGLVQVVAREDWLPRPESLLALGWERWRREERDDPMTLEPLYLRPSNAEENWRQRK